MPEKEGIMETDVDSLMSLLESKEKISIKDAAKELNVKQSVIEEWARYFEEEGLIKITYQFTTPYIEWVGKNNKKRGTTLTSKKDKKSVEAGEPKPLVMKEGLVKDEKALARLEHKKKDVANLMAEAHAAIVTGEFDKAKQTYEKLYDEFNKVPTMFLEKMNQIEDDLIKLNNEIVVKLENKLQEDMSSKEAEILKLLKEAYTELKLNDFDKANEIYNKIKILYKNLPQGFFAEKINLTKKVLSFYENLNNYRSKLAINKLKEKSEMMAKELTAAKMALQKGHVDEASIAYSLAREAYAALPDGYFEDKVALQQKLLEIHQQIVDAKKESSLIQAKEKVEAIKVILSEIVELLKKKEVVIAVQRYGEIKTLYSEMPKGFIKNEHLLQNEILKMYKEITTAKNNLSLEAIHNGKKRILTYIKGSKECLKKNDSDLAFQYYKQSVETYNTLPKGFDKTKVEVRNAIYDTYFEVVSHSDMLTLGELQGYAKDKYFSLLRLIVNAYEIVSTGKFDLLPHIYKNIYIIYQELPLSLVSKKTKLRDGIKNIYLMYKLYLLVDSLEGAEIVKNYGSVQSILTELSGLIEQVINEVPNSAPLINYAKNRLEQFKVQAASLPSKRNVLELPAPNDSLNEEIKIEEFLEKSMNYFTIKNYPKALAYVKEALKINPEHGAANALLEEINNEKSGKGIEHMTKIDELIASAIVKLDEGDYNGAMIDAEQVLKLNPKNEDAFLILQKAKNALRR